MTPRLVLVDRDGVLNRDRPDSVKSADELVMLPDVVRALRRLNEASIAVAVVSNQSVVGRGVVEPAALDRIHAKLRAELAAGGARVDAIYIAPDAPDRVTRRRKPGPGMLEEALEAFGARAPETPMIGDALIDLEAAAAVGCPRLLVRTGKGAALERSGLPAHVQPVNIVEDLWSAVDLVISGRYA